MATRPATRSKACNYTHIHANAYDTRQPGDDTAAITAIYAHHVLHGTGTFEIDPPNIQDMAARRADVLARGLPWLVAEEDGRVAGFACNWFKPRPAYRYSAEDSIYVADHARGRGLGRLLLQALCTHAEAAGCASCWP